MIHDIWICFVCGRLVQMLVGQTNFFDLTTGWNNCESKHRRKKNGDRFCYKL
jgi:hypothetical protein